MLLIIIQKKVLIILGIMDLGIMDLGIMDLGIMDHSIHLISLTKTIIIMV